MVDTAPVMPELFGYFNAFTLQHTSLNGLMPDNFHHADYKCLYLLYRIDAWVKPADLATLGAHSWRWMRMCLLRLEYIGFCEMTSTPREKGGIQHHARITSKGKNHIELVARTLQTEWETQQIQLEELRKGRAFTRKKAKNAKPVKPKTPTYK